MPDEKYLKKLTLSQSVITGAIAGTFEVLINHPLWVIKTRLQCGQTPAWQSRGIYRGLVSNLTTMVPLITLRISLGTTVQNIFYAETKKLTNNQLFISALVGSFIPSIIGSPIRIS